MRIFAPHCFEFKTAKLNSAFCKYLSGLNAIDSGFCTMKLYDSDNVEITQPENESLCVTTVVDWMPTFDYIFLGGEVYMETTPVTDIRMWRFQDPNGLNVPTTGGGVNLRLLGVGGSMKNRNPDPNLVQYGSPTPEFGKQRFVFKHDAGVQQLMQFNLFLLKVV